MNLAIPTHTLQEAFLNGREAHRALVRHLGPVDLPLPDTGERVGVDAIVFTVRGSGRYRVSREPQGLAVRKLLAVSD